MKIKNGGYYLAMLLSATLIACGGQGTGEVENEEATEEVAEETVKEEKKVVYYATPSLVEVATLMKSSGATFSNELLNSPENSNQYTTHNKQALNLGVYGADLAYSAMFDETQSAINYLKTIKKMAEDLGLTGAFESDFLENLEKNIGDRDALLDVVTDFYWSADAYLSDNERPEVSALIIVGGWVESMHIACDMASNSPDNQAIRDRIAEQKLMLKNLILFLESGAGDDEHVIECANELKEIQSIYQSVDVNQGTGNSVTDAQKGETVIGNETTITMSDEQLQSLSAKFEEIRNRFVQP